MPGLSQNGNYANLLESQFRLNESEGQTKRNQNKANQRLGGWERIALAEEGSNPLLTLIYRGNASNHRDLT